MGSDNLPDPELFEVLLQAKKEWETAFDSITDAIYIVSPDSRIVRANLALADMMGQDIRDVINKKCCDFFPHHHEMGCPAKVKGRRTVEFDFKGPPRHFYQESVHQIMNSPNKVVVITDITALKLAEIRTEKMAKEAMDTNERLQMSLNELRRTQSRLIESEKMASIALLAGRLAHEINNPLGFISSNIKTLSKYCQDTIGLLDMAFEQGITDDVRQRARALDLDFIKRDFMAAAQEARDGVRRIMVILKAIANFVGSDEVMTDVNLVDIVQETMNKFEIPKEVGLEIDLEDVPVFKGWHDSIQLAFEQILENAISAIVEKGGGRLIVSLKTRDDSIALTVDDEGIGMTREVVKRAFDPFYTTKSPGPHIGMGLSIAHAVMARHGGSLELKSDPDRGTRVTMRFPLSKQELVE